MRTSTRIIIIIQLCLAFTVLLWDMGYPFMGAHYETKQKLLSYEMVLESPTLENREVYEREYMRLKDKLGESFLEKMVESIRIMVKDIPLFETGWIMMSIVICVLALKQREEANYAAWLLPLLVLTFAIHNYKYGSESWNDKEAKLYPSESYLVEHYLKSPIHGSFQEQKNQILSGWNQFISAEWGSEENFKVARLEAHKNHQHDFNERHSVWLWSVYFGWNLLFAFRVRERGEVR